MFASFVSPAAPVYFPGAPFAAGALLLAGALALAWRFVRPSAPAGARATSGAGPWEPAAVAGQVAAD